MRQGTGGEGRKAGELQEREEKGKGREEESFPHDHLWKSSPTSRSIVAYIRTCIFSLDMNWVRTAQVKESWKWSLSAEVMTDNTLDFVSHPVYISTGGSELTYVTELVRLPDTSAPSCGADVSCGRSGRFPYTSHLFNRVNVEPTCRDYRG